MHAVDGGSEKTYCVLLYVYFSNFHNYHSILILIPRNVPVLIVVIE